MGNEVNGGKIGCRLCAIRVYWTGRAEDTGTVLIDAAAGAGQSDDERALE